MVEKLIFNLFSFTLFILMFLNLVRKNDTNYVQILILQAIGIFLNFIEMMSGFAFNIFIKILMYVFSVILPIIILLLTLVLSPEVTTSILLIPSLICYRRKGQGKALKHILFICFTILLAFADMILKYNVTLVMILPIVLAARYYNKKFT